MCKGRARVRQVIVREPAVRVLRSNRCLHTTRRRLQIARFPHELTEPIHRPGAKTVVRLYLSGAYKLSARPEIARLVDVVLKKIGSSARGFNERDIVRFRKSRA